MNKIFNFSRRSGTPPRRWQFSIFKQNRDGSILLISVLILTAILTISLGVGSLIAYGLIMGRTQTYSTKAYFAAETGAERLLWEVRKEDFIPEDVCDPVTSKYVNFDSSPATCQGAPVNYSLSNGATYYVVFVAGSPDVILNSTGSYQGVRRSVEIKY